MPTMKPEPGQPLKAAVVRRVMDMDEIAAGIATVARPVVQRALEAEAAEAGSIAWKEEAEGALGMLLRDQLPPEGDVDPRLLVALREGLQKSVPPEEGEIVEQSAEVGRVMASAWLQLVALALETKDALPLGEDLLPARGDAGADLWEALRSSLNVLPVGVDEAPRIMQGFAEESVAHLVAVDLPMGVALEVQRGRQPSYIARRR